MRLKNPKGVSPFGFLYFQLFYIDCEVNIHQKNFYKITLLGLTPFN